MKLIIDLEAYEKVKDKLNLKEFILLCTIHTELILSGRDVQSFLSELISVEEKGFIRTIDGVFVLTLETKKLLGKVLINTKSTFEDFWELYHKITTKPKTDKSAAETHWNKLTAHEKIKACDSVILKTYCNNVEPKYRKKARTYLADKNFDDEYETESTSFTTLA